VIDIVVLFLLALAAAFGADAALARREPLASQRRQYLAARAWEWLWQKSGAAKSGSR
jgi:hypothetical protein